MPSSGSLSIPFLPRLSVPHLRHSFLHDYLHSSWPHPLCPQAWPPCLLEAPPSSAQLLGVLPKTSTLLGFCLPCLPIVLQSELKCLLTFTAKLESGSDPQPQQHCSGAGGAGRRQSWDQY